MMLYAGVYLLGVFISAVSQVLLKKEAMKPHKSALAEYLNPSVIAAYTIFVAATLMTVYAYKEVPLSLGPILEATSYVFVAFFGVTVFNERLGKKKIAALALIVVGICVYSLGF
ncbi:MAG: EamA family transporter [Eggerthellales bacterium]|nr:EamA family transporter [Eggerthellales bacterium]